MALSYSKSSDWSEGKTGVLSCSLGNEAPQVLSTLIPKLRKQDPQSLSSWSDGVPPEDFPSKEVFLEDLSSMCASGVSCGKGSVSATCD